MSVLLYLLHNREGLSSHDCEQDLTYYSLSLEEHKLKTENMRKEGRCGEREKKKRTRNAMPSIMIMQKNSYGHASFSEREQERLNKICSWSEARVHLAVLSLLETGIPPYGT